METDASQHAVGGWIWQYETDEPIVDPSKLTSLIRPVAYVSRAFKDHEVRWCKPCGSLSDSHSAAHEIVSKFRLRSDITNDLELSGVRDLETLAITFALDQVDYLVESCVKVVVLTDHRNIIWLLKQKAVRRVRWALKLSMYTNVFLDPECTHA